MKRHLTLLILIFAIHIARSQTHFKPVGDFTQAMTIALMDATVNGTNLVAGDEIGIFDGSLCVGVKVLEQDLGVRWDNKFAVIEAGKSEKATPPYDGFREGNQISFKIWDASEDEEIQNIVISYFDIKTGEEITPPPTFLLELESVGASLKATHNYTPKAKAGADMEFLEGASGSLNGSTTGPTWTGRQPGARNFEASGGKFWLAFPAPHQKGLRSSVAHSGRAPRPPGRLTAILYW